MDPQHWRQIEDLYERALACPPADRPTVLEQACAGDLQLRREVESLLRASDEAGSFLSVEDLKAEVSELATEPQVPMVGRTMARYTILSEIGEGSMGEVYLARDTVLDRQVALKLLPRRFTSDPDRVARFVREAKAASALNHPNILTIHEVGEVDDTWFIAAEFVDGVTLRQRMTTGRVALSEALDIALQCTTGLDAAHRAGIIHRDLKPENVMVRPDGVVKVVDFGLARIGAARSDAPQPGVTQAGHVMGTPRYMSPEQARGETLDERSDIFSLCAILYEMVAGRPAFLGDTTAEVFASLLNPETVAQLKAFDGLPHRRELHRILSRGLHKDRHSRYQTMQALAADLSALGARLRKGGSFPRRPAVLAMAAVAALIGVVSVANVFQWFRPPATPGIRSLAVLPFVNLSNDPERDYLVDGITDQLITDLAKTSAVRVISRTSVMQYKGTSQLLPTIARTLNVEAIVEGSVRRADGRIYVNAQLLDARLDRHLWAKDYDRPEPELWALPAEIARDLGNEVLGLATVGRSGDPERRVTPSAYDAYLHGRHEWNRRTPDGYRKALDHFNNAIDRDPTYAAAYAGVADTYLLLGEYMIWPPQEAFPRARAAATKAIALDETLAQPYAALGQINANEWRWADADREFARAVARDPGYATGHQWRAEFLAISGRAEEALTEIRLAQALDPLSAIINTQLGWILIIARQVDAAIAQLRRTIEIAPRFAQAHTNLGIAYDVRGDHAAALDAFKAAADLSGGADPQLWMARQLAQLGRSGEARAVLRQVLPVAEKGEASPSTVALVYLAVGDRDTALSWLKQGCARRSVGPAIYPPFDPIRTDPRFVAIMKCMELPPP